MTTILSQFEDQCSGDRLISTMLRSSLNSNWLSILLSALLLCWAVLLLEETHSLSFKCSGLIWSWMSLQLSLLELNNTIKMPPFKESVEENQKWLSSTTLGDKLWFNQSIRFSFWSPSCTLEEWFSLKIHSTWSLLQRETGWTQHQDLF